MPALQKLYHVLDDRERARQAKTTGLTPQGAVISSWKTLDEAVHAARHHVISVAAPNNMYSYEEKDEKEDFWLSYKIEGSKYLSCMHVVHKADPEHQVVSTQTFPPIYWGIFNQIKREIDDQRFDVQLGYAVYESLYEANLAARQYAYSQLRAACDARDEGCGAIYQLKEEGIEDPKNKKHFGQHVPKENNKRSKVRCYSVLAHDATTWMVSFEFLLHVRPVVIQKKRESARPRADASRVKRVKTEVDEKPDVKHGVDEKPDIKSEIDEKPIASGSSQRTTRSNAKKSGAKRARSPSVESRASDRSDRSSSPEWGEGPESCPYYY